MSHFNVSETMKEWSYLTMLKTEFRLPFPLCRFFFKSMTKDNDCLVVWEEVKDDSTVLPTYDGKVVGKVERVNP